MDKNKTEFNFFEDVEIIVNEANENSIYRKPYVKLFIKMTDALNCPDINEAKRMLIQEFMEDNGEDTAFREMYFVLVDTCKWIMTMDDKEVFNERIIQAHNKTEEMYI